MIEEHGQIVTGIGIGKRHGRTREMSITECMIQHDSILNVVRPIRPVGVLVNQRLKDNVRRFVRIGGNIVVVEFEMLEKCGVAHIGYAIAGRLLVALSVDQEVRAFVTIGAQQQRTFLDEWPSSQVKSSLPYERCAHLEVARLEHGDWILWQKRPIDHWHEQEEDGTAVLNGVLSIGDVGVMFFVNDGIVNCTFEHHFNITKVRSSLANFRDFVGFVHVQFVGETLRDQKVEFLQILLRTAKAFFGREKRPVARRSTAL